MVDESKKRKKGSISEETISTLLRRYSVNTVFALLQEVSQVAGEKIDWHEMVKNTTTGISDAREYQILWRHLAYGETPADQIDHGQNPMDDDSDLEYELEAFPSVGREASSEAAACVKVLIASGYTNDSHPSNSSTIEAPLTINIPNSKALLAPSDSSLRTNARQGINFTIPVSLQKVPSSGLLGEKRPTNEATGVNVPPKRKRRCWSTKEDLKLTAAANKNVEPDWANIARVEFNDDRKANELSQRWAHLKKKQGNLKVGSNVQQPDQLAAAHRAMSMALDRPMSDNLKAVSAGLTSHQPQKPSAPPPDQPLGRGGALKPQAPTKRPPMNPTPLTPDSMVKAAAVAAGARIASSADASSLLEAARFQNVVHITTGGGGSSLMRPATSITSQLPSNVHFIRNGLAKAPISTYSAAKPAVQPNPAAPTPLYKSAEDAVVSTLCNVAKEVSKHNQVAGPTDMSGSTLAERVPEKKVESHIKPAGQAQDDQVVLQSSEAEDNGKKNSDKEHTSNMIHENEGGDGGLPNKTVVTSEKIK